MYGNLCQLLSFLLDTHNTIHYTVPLDFSIRLHCQASKVPLVSDRYYSRSVRMVCYMSRRYIPPNAIQSLLVCVPDLNYVINKT
jgi:hypothetical protein